MAPLFRAVSLLTLALVINCGSAVPNCDSHFVDGICAPADSIAQGNDQDVLLQGILTVDAVGTELATVKAGSSFSALSTARGTGKTAFGLGGLAKLSRQAPSPFGTDCGANMQVLKAMEADFQDQVCSISCAMTLPQEMAHVLDEHFHCSASDITTLCSPCPVVDCDSGNATKCVQDCRVCMPCLENDDAEICHSDVCEECGNTCIPFLPCLAAKTKATAGTALVTVRAGTSFSALTTAQDIAKLSRQAPSPFGTDSHSKDLLEEGSK